MHHPFAFSVLLTSSALVLPVLVDSAAKGCVLLSIAGIASLMLHRATASLRSAVWLAAMVGLLLFPALSLALPQWKVLPAWLDASHIAQLHNDGTPVGGATSSVNLLEMGRLLPEATATGDEAVARTGKSPETRTAMSSGQPTMQQTSNASFRLWTTVLMATWSCGVLVVCARLLLSQLCLARLLRTSETTASGPLHDMFTASCRQLDVSRPVRLLVSDRRDVPMTWGLRTATIVLPRESRDWRPGRLRAVLLHELAHVNRRDAAAQLVLQLVCAVYWFNPLVWLAAWCARREREQACDDVVLNNGVRPSSYAKHLLAISTGFRGDNLAHVCGLAIAQRFKLEGRLMRILNTDVNRDAAKPLPTFLCCITIGAILVPIAALQAGGETLNAPQPAELVDDGDKEVQPGAIQPTERDKVQADKPPIVRLASADADDADRSAEVALKELGAEIWRNDDGQVMSVWIEDPRFGDESLAHLTKLHWGTVAEDREFEQYAYFHNDYYPRLVLRGTRVTGAGLQQIQEIAPKIADLWFVNNREITDDSLAPIESFANLKKLAIWNTNVTDEGLTHLTKLTKLEDLGLGGAKITDAGLARLATMPRLKVLGLSNTNITNEGLRHLTSMNSLQRLQVCYTGTTDDAIDHIRAIKNLTWLVTGPITDEGLSRLKDMQNLVALNLETAKITDRGMEVLKGLAHLRHLKVDRDTSDAGLEHLQDLVNLEILHIATNSKVTSDGLANLESLPRLKWLSLSKTKIDDKGLEHLMGLTNLRRLGLQDTDVSDQAVEKLQRALPNCRIQQ